MLGKRAVIYASECFQRVARNLSALSPQGKRLALEALQARVTVEQDRLLPDGILPLSIVSTLSGEGVRRYE